MQRRGAFDQRKSPSARAPPPPPQGRPSRKGPARVDAPRRQQPPRLPAAGRSPGPFAGARARTALFKDAESLLIPAGDRLLRSPPKWAPRCAPPSSPPPSGAPSAVPGVEKSEPGQGYAARPKPSSRARRLRAPARQGPKVARAPTPMCRRLTWACRSARGTPPSRRHPASTRQYTDSALKSRSMSSNGAAWPRTALWRRALPNCSPPSPLLHDPVAVDQHPVPSAQRQRRLCVPGVRVDPKRDAPGLQRRARPADLAAHPHRRPVAMPRSTNVNAPSGIRTPTQSDMNRPPSGRSQRYRFSAVTATAGSCAGSSRRSSALKNAWAVAISIAEPAPCPRHRPGTSPHPPPPHPPRQTGRRRRRTPARTAPRTRCTPPRPGRAA